MKTSNSKTDSQKLADTVQMARLRVATAENQWQAAKEQARAAKRRRKEVKLIARRARKQAKQANAELADARKALAKAEAKIAKSGARTTKTRKKPVKQAPVAPRRKQTAPPAASASLKPVTPPKLPGTPTKPVSGVRLSARAEHQPFVVPRDFEKPATIASMPGGKTTVQTEMGREETRSGETEAAPARKGLSRPSARLPRPNLRRK
jgi:hypothetical protein